MTDPDITYLLFAGDNYYPRGGMGDLKGRFGSVEDALAAAADGFSMCGVSGFDWWHVVNQETLKVVCMDSDSTAADALDNLRKIPAIKARA